MAVGPSDKREEVCGLYLDVAIIQLTKTEDFPKSINQGEKKTSEMLPTAKAKLLK